MSGLIVAVDGPGGSGKSTVSRMLGELLDLPHLDTGAFYRAVTLAVLMAEADPDDANACTALARSVRLAQRGRKMFLDGEDVSSRIRELDIDDAISAVSAHPGVRTVMVAAQRDWVAGRGGSAVVEGRDIGTVVFPLASVKVFLTAKPDVRATRRADQSDRVHADVAEGLERRDQLDSTRAVSPLMPAADATVIDTSEMTVERVLETVLSLVSSVGKS